MASSISGTSVPSELDDGADDADLTFGCIWAYPCKLPSCPDYGKTWTLRSNFLLHLQEQEDHMASANTPATRRAIKIAWRYITDPNLPPRTAPYFCSQEDPDEQVWDYNFKDKNGNVIRGRGTMKQMEIHRASR